MAHTRSSSGVRGDERQAAHRLMAVLVALTVAIACSLWVLVDHLVLAVLP